MAPERLEAEKRFWAHHASRIEFLEMQLERFGSFIRTATDARSYPEMLAGLDAVRRSHPDFMEMLDTLVWTYAGQAARRLQMEQAARSGQSPAE